MSSPTNRDAQAHVGGKRPNVVLPPDATILLEARIKAGEAKLQLAAISNLVLHDPVLTLDLLHVANSTQYAGAPVTDIEGALTRLGTARLTEVLSELNVKPQFTDEAALEVIEVLRYNCRRSSIISLIVATGLRPSLSKLARMSGLMADIGHMVALVLHGSKYCDIIKSNKRKMQAFRLQKDLNCDVSALLVKHLKTKGVPKLLTLPFDDQSEAKSGTESDLRFVVRSALEIIDAYDNGTFATLSPDKPLPSRSSLRMLKINPAQHERLYKACSTYLKVSAEEEAPEGSSMLVSAEGDGDASGTEVASPTDELIAAVPVYENTSVKAKSRDALQDFFTLCEQETDKQGLKVKATEYLQRRGLFARSALIKINPNSDDATIEASFGLDKKIGEKISIKDPLSPFRKFRVEIKSTNLNSDKTSAPFGTNAYALGPVDILPTGEKILLYVDLSGGQVLSLELRRVFRLSLGLLTQSLRGRA